MLIYFGLFLKPIPLFTFNMFLLLLAEVRLGLLGAAKVSLFVGTLLNVGNNFDMLFGDDPFNVYKFIFTYTVPLMVSLYSSIMTARRLKKSAMLQV
jgi:hypothetical protein